MAPTKTEPKQTAPGTTGMRRMTRALILDDSEIDILRLRKFCRKAGLDFDIDAAQTIDQMRDLLDGAEYDIVFIDYHLGFDTGLDALAVVQAHPDQVSALPIMVTSVTDHSTAIEAMRSGCADYIVKEELTVSALQKSVASALERWIVLAMTSEAQVMASTLKASVERFVRSCGPETRELIGGLLAGIARLKTDEIDGDLRMRLTMVERGCLDIVTLCDDIATLTLGFQDERLVLSRLQ
ncbi:MAG: response regulator [Marinibacterium profundimaris]